MDENQNGSENRIDCVNHVFQSIAAGNTQAVRQYLSSGNILAIYMGKYTLRGVYRNSTAGGGACNFFFVSRAEGRLHLGAPETPLKSWV